MKLRPYQQAAREGVRRLYRDGQRAALVVLPTGCGKTFTALTMCAATIQNGGRVLWLGHRTELVEQPVATWEAVPELADAGSAGVVQGSKNDCAADLVCASVQTLAGGDRLAQYLEHGLPTVVVVDEAHHSTAGQWRTVLERLDDYAKGREVRAPWWLGLTATPERADGASLAELWGQEPAHVYTYTEAIEDGYLCPPSFLLARLEMDDETRELLARASEDGDEAEMARLLLKAGVVEHTVTEMEALRGRHVMVFTADVEQAKQTARGLREQGWTAAVVSGATPSAKRRAILRGFKRGEIDVLCNCAVLTEGTDLPVCDAIVAARPFASKPLWVQSVGRGLRLYPGKSNCLVLDLVGASQEHSLVMAAGMLGRTAEEDEQIRRKPFVGRLARRVGTLRPPAKVKVRPVDDEGWEIVAVLAGTAESSLPDPLPCVVPDDVKRDGGSTGPNFWADRAPVMADWLAVERGVWACDVGDHGLVMLVDHDDGWMTYLFPRRARKPRPMARRLCDEQIARALGDDLFRQAQALVRKNAAWRGNPPSSKAWEYASRLGIDPTGMSAGEIADAITRHKARQRLAKVGGADGFLGALEAA